MALTYIAKLKSQIKKFMIENLNLFGKMDEGLFVISDVENSPKFCKQTGH